MTTRAVSSTTRTRPSPVQLQALGATDPQKALRLFFDELTMTSAKYRTRHEIAQACGTDDATLLRVTTEATRQLSTVQCLRLALALGEQPADILRIAGRHDDAAVIEAIWPRRPTRGAIRLTNSEQELIHQWRSLSINGKHHAGAIVRVLASHGARLIGPLADAPDEPPCSTPRKRGRQAQASL